jgi:hypothetical protein
MPKKFIMKNVILTTVLALTTVYRPAHATSFDDDVTFLKAHTDVIVLNDDHDQGQIAIAPAWQGRVMTSCSGKNGRSFGWINHELISSGKLLPHMNGFGGEDRFWLGPEGGQFSIFFAKGSTFDLDHWFTPAVIDTLPYKVVNQSPDQVTFAAQFALTNYSGAQFDVSVSRQIHLLDKASAWKNLGEPEAEDVRLVAYETIKITNIGKTPWRKETGLLSVWILGMYNPSSLITIVIPIKPGPDSDLGPKVTSDYFGAVPSDRLVVKENIIYFSGDGKYRSKIGVNPKRSKGVLGSYDAENKVLTVVQFNQPYGFTDYVNSLWKIQDNPYGGDAANSYNDGPATPGAKPMGPFYEIESSSPGARLLPNQSLTHIHRTIHLTGDEAALNAVSKRIFGIPLAEIQSGLKN